MSELDFGGTALAQAPRIPAPPRGGAGRRRGAGGGAWLVWLLALAIGAGLGVAAYQFVPGLDATFDYWLALVLG
jgi:hypothetical protein